VLRADSDFIERIEGNGVGRTCRLESQDTVVALGSAPAGQVVFGKWSEMLICSWVGLDIPVDPFSLATTGEIRVRASLLADIQFRYALRRVLYDSVSPVKAVMVTAALLGKVATLAKVARRQSR
jgi:hypothetical protein